MRVGWRPFAIGGFAVLFHLVPASAQSLTPMRGEVKSVTDSFAVRVYPTNPYDKSIRLDVRIYDQDFRPVPDARASLPSMTLAAQSSRPVVVVVPFDGQRERKVRICAESIPFPDSQARVRAQICGKFLGRRAF
ncbi:hypothetical protein [Aureimonas sp. ME7]|uniref:hypothetical protein n=1 Tax=Aureimonas sp. ME7 TaxID=2744252 RepID=UPI0015F4D7A7|nr:hypothetical protein [Aureimonas sp. ME7]